MNNIEPQVTDAAENLMPKADIGHLLLDMGKITIKDAENILKYQKDKGIRFGQAALELGLISQSEINQVLAIQFDYSYLSNEKNTYGSELIAAVNPFSEEVEALRSLRTQLQLRWFERGFKALVISSASELDASHLLASNLAIVFAQDGARTLLVDANLRAPSLHQLFKLNNNQGLSDLLIDRVSIDNAVKKTPLANLSLLSAGAQPPNPQELLNKDTFDLIVNELSQRYDVIILQTSPILKSSDAQIIAKKVGIVLISVEQNKTILKDAQAAYSACSDLDIEVQFALNNT